MRNRQQSVKYINDISPNINCRVEFEVEYNLSTNTGYKYYGQRETKNIVCSKNKNSVATKISCITGKYYIIKEKSY